MSKNSAFTVDPPDVVLTVKSKSRKRDAMTIEQALSIIFRQMEITGRRPRTIESYDYIFNDFTGQLRLEYVDEITADSIYDYLAAIDVAPSTKLIRLKAIKAVLSRFFDNRWKTNKFGRLFS
ncbi:hypothetical protein [Lysinibacillus xylanilyticus]|uniref:hypothetical protein n=1 Tax=Lysinibacillus xylanilyticus TaxID=582475 RepID=UPI003CFD4ECF